MGQIVEIFENMCEVLAVPGKFWRFGVHVYCITAFGNAAREHTEMGFAVYADMAVEAFGIQCAGFGGIECFTIYAEI